MAFQNRYWSCSRLADWLRGNPKLAAGTSEEWDDWRESAQSSHPVRYWIAEEGLDLVQDFVTWPVRKLYDVKYYINNRWVSGTHALTAHARDIKPGTWHDVGDRFLPCLFNELQDFVEVELAWSTIAWDSEGRKKYNAPFWAKGWFRWRTWRCPKAGLDNLEWQHNLRYSEEDVGKDSKLIGQQTPQARNAEEILTLYKWWTEVYRNRPDPYEASGWTEYCEASRSANGGSLSWSHAKDPKLKKQGARAHKLLCKIEQDYEKEDEQMLIRLIKIRNSLWT
jgi:hypothetical protein